MLANESMVFVHNMVYIRSHLTTRHDLFCISSLHSIGFTQDEIISLRYFTLDCLNICFIPDGILSGFRRATIMNSIFSVSDIQFTHRRKEKLPAGCTVFFGCLLPTLW